MQGVVIYLLGNYAVGKYTIARAICEATGARLFDNHLVNNIVFSLIGADGATPFPPGTWGYIEAIRAQALGAIEALVPPNVSFVFTNALRDGDPMDAKAYQQVVDLAEARGAMFLPVVLTASEAELDRRMGNPDRVQRMKHTDAKTAAAIRARRPVLRVDHPNRLDLDTTALSPAEAAAIIIDRAG